TSALLQRTPDVTFKLVIGQDDLLRESLRSGQLDMIICALAPDSDDVTSFAVLKDEAVVIASKHHPIFKTPLQMSDLCAYRWVLPPVSVSPRKWLDTT
ncbi:LysR substrate-binding domain-containing protein, partial [Pseudomonas viridiflava]|uniref:LysR substrate-binding domain-containing protein n=1 Tax=Pseudomonas viridiflava TaxID=33069 RepID=UPI001F11CF57